MSDSSVAPVGQRRTPWNVWAASVFQATVSGLAIVAVGALLLSVFAEIDGATPGSGLVAAAVVGLVGTPFALTAGLLSGVAAALVITRRWQRWSLFELRWAVACSVFGTCLLVGLLAFSLAPFTVALPFIAAGIAAWRTRDLARPERRGGPAMAHANGTVDDSL